MKRAEFKCSICGETFKTKDERNRHVAIVHKGGRQHQCG